MIRTYFLRWEKHLSSTVTGNITRIGLLSIAYSLMPVTLVSMGMSGEKGDLTYELAFFLLMNVWFIFALITLFDTLCRLKAKVKVNMSSWFDLAYMTLTPIGMWLFLLYSGQIKFHTFIWPIHLLFLLLHHFSWINMQSILLI